MNSHINQRAQPAPAGGTQILPPSNPAADGLDLTMWAMAQGHALSKLQIMSTMAKQVNEQQ